MPMFSTPNTALVNSQHQQQQPDEIPFEWRGGVNDALYQATQATTTFQIQKLKRSIIRYFVLSLALPCIALLLISLAIFFSTGFQFYACFIVLLFLAFLIVYRVMWLTRLLRAIHNPDNFYFTNSSNILVDPHSNSISQQESGEIQVLPPPPPTYEVAQRSPPTYELYKWSDISLMNNQSQTNFNRLNIPSYQNVTQIRVRTSAEPSTSAENIIIPADILDHTQNRNSIATVTLSNYQNQSNNSNISSLNQQSLDLNLANQLTPLPRVYQRTNNQSIIA